MINLETPNTREIRKLLSRLVDQDGWEPCEVIDFLGDLKGEWVEREEYLSEPEAA